MRYISVPFIILVAGPSALTTLAMSVQLGDFVERFVPDSVPYPAKRGGEEGTRAPAVRNKHYEPAALYDPYTGEQLETLEGYNFRIGNHAFPSIAQWRALEALHGVPPRVFADDAIKKQSELAAHGGKNPLREGDPRIPELQKAHRAAKSGSPQTDDARA